MAKRILISQWGIIKGCFWRDFAWFKKNRQGPMWCDTEASQMWCPSHFKKEMAELWKIAGKKKELWPPKLTRFPQAHSTDVVLSSLRPPRTWSGAGVGVKMLRGIPLLENRKACRIYQISISCFLIDMKIPLFENRKVGGTYQFLIACFWIVMKFISKSFSILFMQF